MIFDSFKMGNVYRHNIELALIHRGEWLLTFFLEKSTTDKIIFENISEHRSIHLSWWTMRKNDPPLLWLEELMWNSRWFFLLRRNGIMQTNICHAKHPISELDNEKFAHFPIFQYVLKKCSRTSYACASWTRWVTGMIAFPAVVAPPPVLICKEESNTNIEENYQIYLSLKSVMFLLIIRSQTFFIFRWNSKIKILVKDFDFSVGIMVCIIMFFCSGWWKGTTFHSLFPVSL